MLHATAATVSAHWAFEEGGGAFVIEAASNLGPSRIHGNPAWVPGKAGRALRFDGKTRIEVPSAAVHPWGGDFTVTLWFQSTRAGGSNHPASAILSRMKGGAGFELTATRDGHLAASAKGAGNGMELLPAGRKILDGQWHHLAAVYSSSRLALFVDGVSNSQVTGAWSPTASDAPLSIGGREGPFAGYVGLIDELRVYRGVLSPSELAADLKAGGGLSANPVSAFKNRDTGAALTGNLVRNGSFEAGEEHWYPQFGDRGLGPNAADLAAEKNASARILAVEGSGYPHGRRALRMDVFEGCMVRLNSAFFPLRFGYPVVVTFQVKAPAIGKKFSLRVGYDREDAHAAARQTFKVEKEGWQKYSLAFTPPPSPSRSYFLDWSLAEAGEWWMDAVSVTEGESGAAYAPNPINVGWERADSNHPANLFYRDEIVRFNLLAETRPGPAFVKLYGRVVNAWGETVARVDETIPLSKEGLGKSGVILSAAEQGGFKCEFFTNARLEGVPLCEVVYGVIPKLKPSGDAGDSFFGGHVALTPWNLELARRAGFRWLRLSGPACTKWWSLEKEGGKMAFFTQGVERASRMGFRILGSLDSVPPFYGDPGSKANPREPGWASGLPPRDLSLWRGYVSNTCAAYALWIQHWEIWNEPDGALLQPPPGSTREKVYVSLVANARRALGGLASNLTLVGGAVSSLKNPFLMEALTNGLAPQINGASFHFNFEEHSPNEAPNPPALAILPKILEMPGYGGKPLSVWHTEGGPWHGEGGSWLRSARIPSTSALSMIDLAGTLVRTMASLKAIGVARHFQYQCFAHPSGAGVTQDEGGTMIDRSGAALPTFVAHAVAVSMLEGADGRGVEELAAGDAKVLSARFLRAGKAIDVVWSRIPVKLRSVAHLRWQDRDAFDLMGNPVDLNPETRLTQAPIYLRTAAKK
ncbi:MAG: hypothetical protein J0L75_01005 [Spirochaetes bacterium]|nr:hypothetical protein [Spirochaetota bacterium]